MRKKIVAGNWKMNLSPAEGDRLVREIIAGLPVLNEKSTVVIAPPFLHIAGILSQVKGEDNLYVGAQNCHQEPSGAFTGEVSPAMLQAAGVRYVILGHSERRLYFGEDDALL